MSDYSKLKQLTESAPTGPWIVENDSIFFKDNGYTRHLLDADAGHDVKEDDYYAALDFIAAANPAAIMGLILENEELKASYEALGKVYSGTQKGFDKLRAECEALRKNAERYMVLRQADVDTIQNGGLFAGLTPANIVINGHHLDEQADSVIAARKQIAP